MFKITLYDLLVIYPCKRYVRSILGMWQARTGTTGFDVILGECHVGQWSCDSSNLMVDDRRFT